MNMLEIYALCGKKLPAILRSSEAERVGHEVLGIVGRNDVRHVVWQRGQAREQGRLARGLLEYQGFY